MESYTIWDDDNRKLLGKSIPWETVVTLLHLGSSNPDELKQRLDASDLALIYVGYTIQRDTEES